MARDPSTWDAWAVVKLDWHYPPYLTALPQLGAGHLVGLVLRRTDHGIEISVDYHYAQQEDRPEAGSIVRLYHQAGDGSLTLLQEHTDRAPFLVAARDLAGVRVSVTPRSVDKPGREYFADRAYADDPVLTTPTGVAIQATAASQVTLAWAPYHGAGQIEIERRDTPGGAFHLDGTVDASTATRFVSGRLQPGTLYSWRIAACAGGTCSPYSPVLSAVASRDQHALPRGAFQLGTGFSGGPVAGAPWPRSTNGDATLWLYPAVDGPLDVTLSVDEPVPLRTDMGSDIDLSVNGEPVPRASWTVEEVSPGSYSVSFMIPAAVVGTPVELTLSSPIFVPALMLSGSVDTSPRGVELRSVDIRSGNQRLVMVDGLPVPKLPVRK